MLQSISSPHSISPGFSSQSVKFLLNLPPIGHPQALKSKHSSISVHLANKSMFSDLRQSPHLKALSTIDHAISPEKADYPASLRLRVVLARAWGKSTIEEFSVIYFHFQIPVYKRRGWLGIDLVANTYSKNSPINHP